MPPASKKKTSGKKVTKKAVARSNSGNKASQKTTSKKRAIKKTVIKKKPVSKKRSTSKKPVNNPVVSASLSVTPEERWKMVAVAAYLKAEKRGFATGNELDDWTEAEREIDMLFHG